MKKSILAVLTLLALTVRVQAQDKVFSGPQVGEKITPFKVLAVTGPHAGKEIDYVTEFKGAPTVLLFFHGIERSMLPLVRVVDQYGAERKDALRTLMVFLTDDRVALEQRLPLVAQSMRAQAPVTISLDGAEGPGNYGLNKKCLLTLIMAKDNKVTANFALVQPGIADAPKVIAEIAKIIGDTKPPTAEELEARRRVLYDTPQRPNAARSTQQMDLSRFDLNTEQGLRDAVKALIAEVQALRREVAELRGSAGASPSRPAVRAQDLPGAAPTDAKLIGLLRSFIQPTNDTLTVDRVVKEVEEYVKGNADLTKQAIDGWTRVLFLKYGTEYAQTKGKELVERLKR
jgi:hypothetical protein